jgi:hypothetical protein
VNPRLLACALVFALSGGSASAQPAGQPPDVLLQGFYWNTHPGDHSLNHDGLWWDSLRITAEGLAAAGFQTVWLPPPAKGAGGRFSMGYDLYDYYDLGRYDQKFTRRTRFGTVEELAAMQGEFARVGLRTMVDAVLNHRDGGDAQQTVECVPGGGNPWSRYTLFTPASGRLPAHRGHFHPTLAHCDEHPPYHNAVFGQDLCYFNLTDNVLTPGAPGNGWYHGPHDLGYQGDSLVVWGRWLMDEAGFDELRVDAVKHVEPGFLAPWLVELAQGGQPFAVGEYYGSTGEIIAYHDQVERFVGTYGTGTRDANLALFDFDLRFALKGVCDGRGFYDLRALNTTGLHFNGLDPFDVVTFVENHDFDRTGFVGANCGEPGAMPYGNTCVRLSTDVGHDPVLSRKHLAYAYVMAAEGRPSVWWKDWAWYGLDEEIAWLMALRRLTAQGESTPMSGLNPNPELPQADLWALRRWGAGEPRYGALVAINDNDGAELSGWLDSPHARYELRDYSDAYLFASTEAYADGRAFVRAPPGNYAWYAPTGLYPRPLDEPPSHFALEAQPGGKLHYVALRAADAAQFIVNGAPIQPGDEVAVLGPSGAGAAGLGRVGQRFRWDGTHDLLVEVLGNADGTNADGRLKSGDPLRLAVYDASTGTTAEAGSLTWAASGSTFTFDPARPASRGGAFPLTVTDADGRYTVGGVSRVAGFQASSAPVAVTAAPLDPPVVIPPDGGTFAYEVRLQNLTTTAQTFQAWADVLLPNGAPYGPVIGPVSVTLPAAGAVTRTLNQRVPYSAPAGTYTYRVFVGPAFGTPWTSASFPFTKAPPESRAVGRPGSWYATEAGSYHPIAAIWTVDGLDTPEVRRVAPVTPVPFRLDAVYPVPFREGTTIRFTAPPGVVVRVEVYDALGRRVRVLYDAAPATSGTHTVPFDASGLPSGTYLVRLTGAAGADARRVVLLR